MSDIKLFTPAKRGDLVLIETQHRDYVIGQPTREHSQFEVYAVVGITRDGHVAKVRSLRDDDYHPMPIKHMTGFARLWVIPQHKVDTDAVKALVRSIRWNHDPEHVKGFWDNLDSATCAVKACARETPAPAPKPKARHPKASAVKVEVTAYPDPGHDLTTATFHAELSGHGVVVRVELWRDDDGRPFYVVTGPRYRCIIPACLSEHVPCALPKTWRGRCPEHGNHGIVSRPGEDMPFCHSQTGGTHAEHAVLFARTVLDTYGPKGVKVPRNPVGVPSGSISGRAFLPLDGRELVLVHYAGFGSPKYRVTCDAVRCRDEYGRTSLLLATDVQDEAYRVRSEHIEWHRAQLAAAKAGA